MAAAGEIIHHHDLTRFQDRGQMLLDPSPEQRTVDGSVDGDQVA